MDKVFIISLHRILENNEPKVAIPLITDQIEDRMLKFLDFSNDSINFTGMKLEAQNDLSKLYATSKNQKSESVREIDKDLFVSCATKYMQKIKNEVDSTLDSENNSYLSGNSEEIIWF
jgi:hypothetical protein